jgi:hypothetical protein
VKYLPSKIRMYILIIVHILQIAMRTSLIGYKSFSILGFLEIFTRLNLYVLLTGTATPRWLFALSVFPGCTRRNRETTAFLVGKTSLALPTALPASNAPMASNLKLIIIISDNTMIM